MSAITRLAGRISRIRWLRLAAPFVILVIAWAAASTGFAVGLDRKLAELRFSALDRPADDSFVLVEIDAASLAELNEWPWPRGDYADVIKQLNAAGARLIAFDVDFSARGDEAGDQRLADAIAATAGRVVLPTFKQSASSAAPETLIESRPQDRFSDAALFANVNVVPDTDGIVRRDSYGAETDGVYRPTIAALLADAEYGRTGDFDIDFGIDVKSIRRLSFADVRAGRFDPEAVRGRVVFIGGTALELGDQLVAPRYRLLSGPELHALAYQSLRQGRALHELSPVASFALALLVVLALCRRGDRWRWRTIGVRQGLVLGALLLGPLALQAVAPVIMNVAPALLAQGLCLLCSMVHELEKRAREILAHRTASVRRQALIQLTLRDSQDGIIATDRSGRIQVCNPRAAQLLRQAGCDLTDQLLAEVAPEFLTYDAAGARSGRRSEDGPLRYQYTAKAGGAARAIDVTASLSVLDDGGDGEEGADELVVYTLHDVTARVRLARAEAAAKAAALEASAAKTRFIATMSHELRTPLNAVIGFSESIRAELYGAVGAPEYKEFADYIHDSGRQLLSVVNGVLEVARLDAGDVALACAPADVDELVATACKRAKDKLDARGLSVEVSIGAGAETLDVDPAMLQRMFDELIANAAEHANADGRVIVSARLEHDGGMVIEVRNPAAPISRAVLDTLTQPFVQADARMNREHEGVGLGLHLAERYVDLHGGEMELESQSDGEFVVRIKLPRSAVRASHGVRAA